MAVRIRRAPATFGHWPELLKLLRDAFAYQDGRIDPPSSVHALDLGSIREKTAREVLFLATEDDVLLGCVFAEPQGDCLYVSKLAVRPDRQGEGIARRLMQVVEEFARQSGRERLTLNTRIELTENHRTFAALGFVKTAELAHEGFDRPTFISMELQIGSARTPGAGPR